MSFFCRCGWESTIGLVWHCECGTHNPLADQQCWHCEAARPVAFVHPPAGVGQYRMRAAS